MKRIFTLAFMAAALTGCATKTVYQTNSVYVQDCNGTHVEIRTSDTQPTDVARGLSATMPAGGF